MRIAVVAPGYAPSIGGVETVVTRVCESLAGSGCELEVWTHRTDASLPAVTAIDRIVVRRFATGGTARYPLSPQLWRHTVRHADDFDVVHAHSYHSAAALGLAAAKVRTAAVVVSPHYHGVGHTMPARVMHRGYGPLGRRIIAAADAVIAVSAAEEELLREDFPKVAHRITVVHNGADTETIRGANPWPDEPPTALVVGRLEPYKRVERTINAFAAAEAGGQLVVIGDGPDRARLERVAHGSQQVRFLGRVSDTDLARWWRTARVTVTMSEHEAFGVVALEAVAGGGRALLSDIEAHREVASLAGHPCVLIRTDEDLVSQLQLALQTGNAGPRRVRSWSEVADDYLGIYRRLLATR